MIRKIRKLPGRVALFLGLGLFTVFAAFPVYWMINTALSTDTELYKTGQGFWLKLSRLGDIPAKLAEVPIFSWIANSGIVAFGTTFLSLVLAVMAAYALSRFKFHGKGLAAFVLFATQMLPEALLVVPLFALFASFGLLNELHGLVLANTAFTMPVAIFILKSAIDKIPYEIEESARIDGCPRSGQLTMIILPLIVPSVAAAAVINFFDGWNEFLFANTFISDAAKWPASVGLASFVGQYATPLSSVMTAAFLFTIPAIVFFLIVQRQIVSGLTAGAVKG
ncbi:carbohydrate ABC transporter permease [Leucobacter sp. M11]|uniref:carbohydrate ABC transporter permease n=1 Tax=Leucobacter sp. M11 TaxID=2993565 RepID=UPI002D802A5E|nr:carbohydrate ABC transporter permease [Leucobacter sp. M11]MEB4614570.1 carbohydrate ABC transporter permease [Leucobacter sp. M11]